MLSEKGRPVHAMLSDAKQVLQLQRIPSIPAMLLRALPIFVVVILGVTIIVGGFGTVITFLLFGIFIALGILGILLWVPKSR